jgi:hypothetical protein
VGDGAPISQEIKLPTDISQLTAATAKLDELIGRVDKLEHATKHTHEATAKHHQESEHGFRALFDTMGKVVRREAELAVGIHAVGMAGLQAHEHLTEFLEFIGAEFVLEKLKEIAEKVYDVGKEALHSAAAAERMNFALDSASGGKEAGENVRKWVEANAKFSEFTEAQNESAFLNLRRFGVGKDKAGLYMKAAEDLAAVSAPDQRQGVYQESLDAFARLHAKGRLDARSAMRLGIGVEDLKTLPGFGGLTNAKVFEKAEKSNLDENTLMSLIMRHTGEKAIGEKAADASQLLLTKFTKLSELPELFYKRLGETGATKKLASEVDVILEKLDPESPIGRRIFGALESAFESITNAVGEIDFESLADTITDDVIPAIRDMIALIGPALHAVETTVHGLGIAAHFISGRKTGQEQAAAENAYQKNALVSSDAAAGFWSKAWASVKTPFLAADAGMEKPHGESTALPYGLPARYYEAGKAAATGYAKGIESGTSDVAMSSADMGEASHSSLMESIDAHSPSRKFAKAGGFAAEGYALGIEGGGGRIDDAMDSTFSIPTGAGYNPATSIAGVGLGARGPQLTIGGITINVQGGTTNAETAGAVRDELVRSLRPMLVDLLEQQDAEG